MSPTYNYISLVQAQQQLSNRLYDATQQFWPPAELTLYIQESLRTWNALTSYWRNDFLFPTIPSQIWYDLTALPGTFRPFTVTDDQLYRIIQFHLLEPSVGVNPWAGVSSQFTADDLVNAVQRRRDEILSTCACTITRRTVPATNGRIILPDTVIDIRRMAYLPVVVGLGYGLGLYGVGGYGGLQPAQGPTASVIWPDDSWSEQSFNYLWTLQPAGIPSTYVSSTEPPLTFDVDRPPAFGGQYELLTVEAGPVLSPTTPQLMPIPDDWTHVLKWGALADLFSRESNAKDPLRATYCEQRYQMGLKMLTDAPALLSMRLGNAPLQVDAVRAADLYDTSWEGATSDLPQKALTSGLNLFALSPSPSAGPFSLMATVVQNAPLPVLAADPLQVGRDDLDVIIDYAQHLAFLKCGGAEFMATIPLFQRFLKHASIYGLKLAEFGEYMSVILALSQRESQMNPTMAPQPAGAS